MVAGGWAGWTAGQPNDGDSDEACVALVPDCTLPACATCAVQLAVMVLALARGWGPRQRTHVFALRTHLIFSLKGHTTGLTRLRLCLAPARFPPSQYGGHRHSQLRLLGATDTKQ